MSAKELSAEELNLIAEEEEIFRSVRAGILEARRKRSLSNEQMGQRLEALRDEAVSAKSADLPALFDQMNTQRALFEHRSESRGPDLRSPYFAHMCLEEKGKRRDVLLGHASFLDSRRFPIIDWKHAPISRIFFNYREGDEFEEQLPGRLSRGVLVKRRVLTIFNGELVRIHAAELGSFRRLEDGSWVKDGRSFIPQLAGGSGSAKRALQGGLNLSTAPAPEVSALLDPDQFRLLTADPSEPLLILGGAGCGKTTIALHRAAYLQFKSPQIFAQSKTLVVVPEEGLVRLSRKLLDSLELPDVEVRTFDAWVEIQARRMLRGLPDKLSPYVPASVSRIKRHPALLTLFPEIVRRQMEEIISQAERELPGASSVYALLRERTELPMLERLDLAERTLLRSAASEGGAATPMRQNTIKKFFERCKKRYGNTLGDRTDLFTNYELLQGVAAAAAGAITEGMLRDLISHCLDQLGQSAEQSFGGYDSERLETVDGRSLIEQESEDTLAGTIDPEDFALLLELQYFKSGRSSSAHGRLKTYSHMVIDEAQDLAEVELKVLGRALSDEAAITIAGDAAQQIDPTHSFESWERVLHVLGQPQVHANQLKTTYRSTKSIAALAHAVLGPLAPAQPAIALREGQPVARTLFPSEGQMVIFLSETLTELMDSEPLASVAIITKNEEYAEALYKLLIDVPRVRLVERGGFEFKPGIDITPASEVKGLEFDYVVIPDANRGVYVDRPQDRRLLHVALTRAIHQLWVIAVGQPAAILPPED